MTGRPSLSELVQALRRDSLLIEAPRNLPRVSEIVTDSRGVREGSLFVAVRGSQTDGHDYVIDSARRGAAAVIVERKIGVPVPEIVVTDGRRAAITLARTWFDDPAREMLLVGVTGTNGKTTTAALMRHLLNEEGAAGSIGTLGAFDGAGESVPSVAGSLTTPGPVDLQATFAALRDHGVRRVAMEASSHSLDQGRLDGLSFDGAIFTNLTRDHLDYHRTMEEYHAAKLKLMASLAPDGVASVNHDDPAWRTLWTAARSITWGVHPDAMLRASDLELGATGSRFRVSGRFGEGSFTLPLPGDFNVANALGAAAVSLGMGRSLSWVGERFAVAPQVTGRMERIVEDPCVVLRDYSHTPDSLERALQALRPLTKGRLIVVYGCGGDRDRGKRPIMGRIAAELADLSVITSDNPRTEDPERIIDDIVRGVPNGTPFRRVADRREAIRVVLAEGKEGDTILLAGKGHETYQVIGKEYLPFDEREIVLGLLGKARQ
ncbi:MAG: UDP-N-acetylmuramoyl-L-alanyl-D-glutamate--2,6-diaminopimelate ligase [Gemmatimonadota bacterium]